jgi:hypothetical protein
VANVTPIFHVINHVPAGQTILAIVPLLIGNEVATVPLTTPPRCDEVVGAAPNVYPMRTAFIFPLIVVLAPVPLSCTPKDTVPDVNIPVTTVAYVEVCAVYKTVCGTVPE